MKILELCEYSSGVCGVFNRVLAEAQLLSKKHSVIIYSSNLEKGTGKIAASEQRVGNVDIKRFPVKWRIKEGTGGILFWDFKKSALELKPDIIITHNYRHPHNNQALKVARKLQAKCFIVTHAPFVEQHLRSWKGNLGVFIYDSFFSRIKRFDKIIAITKWELPYLEKLGIPKEKIIYIPNGVPTLFFKESIKLFKARNILFFGRISPIKNLEILIKAYAEIKKRNNLVLLKIIGPEEPEYAKKMKELAASLNLDILFLPPVNALKEKIKTIQEADIFALTSKREAMPQALIEAMALGKVVISSDNPGSKDIIEHEKNGFLFQRGNESDLAQEIMYCLDKRNNHKIKQIQKQARKAVEQFSWSSLIKKLEALIGQKQE